MSKLINYSHVLTILLFTTACTNLFLQPSTEKFFDPHQANIHYKEDSIASLDGTRIAYWRFPPQNYRKPKKKIKKIKPKALMLHYHGNGENMSTHFRGVMWPLLEDFEVITFDYRGYGASEGDIDIDGTYEDSLAMLKWAGEEAKKQNIPLVIFGQSLGGSLVLKALQEHKPEMLKFIIIESAFYDYKQIAREKLSEHWLTYVFQPLTYLLVSSEYSPSGHGLKKISPIPIVLIYSTADPVVGHNHGELLFNELSEPKQIWLHPNPGHINALWVEQGKYKDKLIREMRKSLPLK